MNIINDKDGYLSKMRKTFIDKSWFMSIVPTDVKTIVDFGAADGSFIHYLAESFPEYQYIGIDNNKDFISIMEKRGVTCFYSLPDLAAANIIDPDTTLLVLNSVIHEVYSYWAIDEFWKQVSDLNPKYVAIRDMYAKGCGIYGSRTQDELTNEILKDGLFSSHYKDFRKYWGDLTDGYTATHFLLKYFYNENWDREVRENYIPFHYRELHTKIRKIGYNVTFERFYGLPFLKDKWHKNFHCENNPHLKTFVEQITTHMKLFLVRGFDK